MKGVILLGHGTFDYATDIKSLYKIFKLLFQAAGQDSDNSQIMLSVHLLLTLGYKKIVHLLKRSEHELREDEIDQNRLIDNMFNKLFK